MSRAVGIAVAFDGTALQASVSNWQAYCEGDESRCGLDMRYFGFYVAEKTLRDWAERFDNNSPVEPIAVKISSGARSVEIIG